MSFLSLIIYRYAYSSNYVFEVIKTKPVPDVKFRQVYYKKDDNHYYTNFKVDSKR